MSLLYDHIAYRLCIPQDAPFLSTSHIMPEFVQMIFPLPSLLSVFSFSTYIMLPHPLLTEPSFHTRVFCIGHFFVLVHILPKFIFAKVVGSTHLLISLFLLHHFWPHQLLHWPTILLQLSDAILLESIVINSLVVLLLLTFFLLSFALSGYHIIL